MTADGGPPTGERVAGDAGPSWRLIAGMLDLQTAAGPAAEWPSIGAIDPAEVIAIVLTALAANAFTYGALLQLHGVVTTTTTVLLVAGGAVTLASAGWLMVLSFVTQVVGT